MFVCCCVVAFCFVLLCSDWCFGVLLFCRSVVSLCVFVDAFGVLRFWCFGVLVVFDVLVVLIVLFVLIGLIVLLFVGLFCFFVLLFCCLVI